MDLLGHYGWAIIWAVLYLSYSIGLHGHKGNNKHKQLLIASKITYFTTFNLHNYGVFTPHHTVLLPGRIFFRDIELKFGIFPNFHA